MNRHVTMCLTLLNLPPAGAAVAQGIPGANVVVHPRVTNIALSSGTSTIALSVVVDISSPESLFIFTIDAPSPTSQLVKPQPAIDWMGSTVYRGRNVASWGALNPVAPGDTTPSLSYSAPGLPGIDTAWAEGFYPPAVLDDTASDTTLLPTPDVDPLESGSVQLLAVGVDPIPSGSTVASLITRLDSLRGQSCTLSWITSTSLCTTLHGYLTTQPTNLSQFNTDLAAGHTTGGPVTDNGYWLLKANADYIISISPPPVNTALITLTYVCANKFKVLNHNNVAVPLTWNVINGQQTGAVTVPAKSASGVPGSAFIITQERRTVRLYYNGQLIRTTPNGNKGC